MNSACQFIIHSISPRIQRQLQVHEIYNPFSSPGSAETVSGFLSIYNTSFSPGFTETADIILHEIYNLPYSTGSETVKLVHAIYNSPYPTGTELFASYTSVFTVPSEYMFQFLGAVLIQDLVLSYICLVMAS